MYRLAICIAWSITPFFSSPFQPTVDMDDIGDLSFTEGIVRSGLFYKICIFLSKISRYSSADGMIRSADRWRAVMVGIPQRYLDGMGLYRYAIFGEIGSFWDHSCRRYGRWIRYGGESDGERYRGYGTRPLWTSLYRSGCSPPGQ